MRSALIILIFASYALALEAILSYPNELQNEALDLRKKTLESFYLGLSNDAYLGKNGLFALKTEKIDLLYIKKQELTSLNLLLDSFNLYNLKIVQETPDYYLLSRLSWFNALPQNAKETLHK